MNKVNISALVVIGAIASPFIWIWVRGQISPMEAIVFFAVIVTAVVYWQNAEKEVELVLEALNEEQSELELLVLGMLDNRLSPSEMSAINKKLIDEGLTLEAELVRNVQVILDSIDIFLSSKNTQTAQSRVNTVIDLNTHIQCEYAGFVSSKALSEINAVCVQALSDFEFTKNEQEKPVVVTTKPQGFIHFFGLSKWWESSLTNDERERIVDHYVQATGVNDLSEGSIQSSAVSKVRFLQQLASYCSKGDFMLSKKIIEQCEASIGITTDTQELHSFYGKMVRLYYRHRKEAGNYELAKHYAKLQISIAPKVLKAMKEEDIEIAKSSLIRRTGKQAVPDDFSIEFYAPSHVGYQQLAIIYKKEKRWHDVVALCNQAKTQGWTDDWDKRINEAQQQLAKLDKE